MAQSRESLVYMVNSACPYSSTGRGTSPKPTANVQVAVVVASHTVAANPDAVLGGVYLIIITPSPAADSRPGTAHDSKTYV